MRGTLAPHLEDFIGTVNQAIAKAKLDGVVPTPELAREKLAALSAFVTKVPDIAYCENKTINAITHLIPVTVYSPAPTESLPVVVYFHGGGHMCGDTELYDPMCRKIALAGNCVVVSVEYRLSPEHPYPAGLKDAEAVMMKVQTVLDEVSYEPKYMVAGDSGGGAICASLSMLQAQGTPLNIDKQILIYPSLDYTLSKPSVDFNGTGYFLEKPRIQWYFDNYFLNNEDRKQASPLFGEVNRTSPTTLVILAGCDPLLDEGQAYADKLIQSGVKVETKLFANMIHAFMNIEDLVPDECAELFNTIGKFIRS